MVIVIFRCVRTQLRDCCNGAELYAAARRVERSLMQSTVATKHTKINSRTKRPITLQRPMFDLVAEAAAFYHHSGMLLDAMVLALNHVHHFTHFVWGRKACAA